ncbi:IS4 family transposase [Schinkia azotoformans]|uniref:Transposase IS4 family protein n=1 Tax=Schinkia azotoformans LMG 9581 TaxID=1131731 RepID=K6E9E1_SCHAZ|nr:IS4 family transposase [Schinkia azotoformans]EKN69961.1 transposase IS4 family protein [Schinkia azotoformans LMG 9581]MEC1947547.1 IS4 family transposase [Schinkia azotoformans]MED4355095.1 IS4 family transposase [Schinkia azotoformans]
MIDQNSQYNQLPKELNSVFSELEMNKHLRQAGIKKSFGFGCTYLFQLIFCLIFQHKNWFSLLDSKKAEKYPAKDAVYRFLNESKFNWRRFLLLLSSFTIQKVARLTDKNRPKVLIVDDSAYDRNRSKKVELLARCFNHASLRQRHYKGFTMLTLGWSDGYTFMPIDFSLLSSKNTQINGISEQIDKRTCGYKRRENALQSKPEQLPDMIKRALTNGIDASYVLMDSWFTMPPLVKAIVEQGLDVIGMVKETKQRYNVNGKLVSLKQLYRLAQPTESKKGILRSIHTVMANGTPIKVVFIQNRNKKSEWLAILSTDCTLTEQEIVRIYGMRWDIEVFFKTAKSLLKLEKEFQSRSYDGLISHTTIVFARFIVLSWQNRCNTDQRTIGGLFYELCDEVNELDWAVALQQLIELFQDALKQAHKKIKKLIQSQLEKWIASLPNYIKAYLSISLCES